MADEVLYIGVDPGLTAPCMCVFGNAQEPLAVKFIDGKPYQGWGTYERAFTIACEMAKFVKHYWPDAHIHLAIEGPSYGDKQTSSSMEQMAYCRQAVHDAFSAFLKLSSTDSIAPTSAKKALTGNGRAQKEDMITFARVVAPKIMAKMDTWRKVKRRSGKVEEVLNERTVAMADSIGVAVACKNRWNR